MKRTVVRLAQERSASSAPGPFAWRNPGAPSGTGGVLAGKSLAIKDNISYSKAPTECSSRILQGYVPPYDATCVQRLVAEGAHIAGKVKMDEFGMGSGNTHMPEGYGPVHNPSGPDGDAEPRTPGGSSGGSAAAVAQGDVWAALGTDTGGSVRLPASYCGVVGLKPSYGMVSRYGVVSYADSLDCVGVLGKTVDTVAEVFGVISHPDENDMSCASAQSREAAATLLAQAPTSVQGLRIGIPVQTHVEGNFQLPTALLEHMRDQGATLHAVDMPALPLALPAYYVLSAAEAASNLGRFGGGWYGSTWERERVDGESGVARRRRIRTEGFGYEVRKRIMAGTHALTADAFNNSYLKALHLRRVLRREYASVLRIPHPLGGLTSPPPDGVDVILHPTSTSTAPKLDQSDPRPASEEYLQDVLTTSASLAGLPAMSVPAGVGADGWPLGVSLTGQWGMEDVVFTAGRAVESWQP